MTNQEEQPKRHIPNSLELWLSEDSKLILFSSEQQQNYKAININTILKLYSEFNQYKNN